MTLSGAMSRAPTPYAITPIPEIRGLYTVPSVHDGPRPRWATRGLTRSVA